MLNNITFAGIQTVHTGEGVKYHFHATRVNPNQQLGIWLKMPGAASFVFVEVPKGSSKLDAAKFILEEKNGFGEKGIQDFLKVYIEKGEKTLEATNKPKRSVGRPKKEAEMPQQASESTIKAAIDDLNKKLENLRNPSDRRHKKAA